MKAPIDITESVENYYQTGQLSPFGIYPTRSRCLGKFIAYTRQEYPKQSFTETLTTLMRSQQHPRISQWISPRVVVAPFGVATRSESEDVERIRRYFPDVAYIDFIRRNKPS